MKDKITAAKRAADRINAVFCEKLSVYTMQVITDIVQIAINESKQKKARKYHERIR